MTWRAHNWPTASPVYPIDTHPAARHTARGFARTLNNLYHGFDQYGKMIAQTAMGWKLAHPDDGMQTQEVYFHSVMLPVSTAFAIADSAFKRLRADFVFYVATAEDAEGVVGDVTLEASVEVTGTAGGATDTGQAVIYPVEVGEFDQRYLAVPGSVVSGTALTPGDGNRIKTVWDLDWGAVRGSCELDIANADMTAAGLIVTVRARCLDSASSPLHILPSHVLYTAFCSEP